MPSLPCSNWTLHTARPDADLLEDFIDYYDDVDIDSRGMPHMRAALEAVMHCHYVKHWSWPPPPPKKLCSHYKYVPANHPAVLSNCASVSCDATFVGAKEIKHHLAHIRNASLATHACMKEVPSAMPRRLLQNTTPPICRTHPVLSALSQWRSPSTAPSNSSLL